MAGPSRPSRQLSDTDGVEMMRLVISDVEEENTVFQWIAKKPKERR